MVGDEKAAVKSVGAIAISDAACYTSHVMPKISSVPSYHAVRTRSLWLLVLLVVTGSLAYPDPANWVLARTKAIIGVDVGQIQRPFVLGLDLQGGTHLEYEADVSRVPHVDRRESLDGVRDVIERRVNAMGVAEPLIQTTQAGDSWRVTVELAGVRDINQAIKMIGETPILEFKEEQPETKSALTEEQKEKMDADNATAKRQAEAVLAEARKQGADFSHLSVTTTDLGFLRSSSDNSDLLEKVGSARVGSVIDHVVERPHAYAVVKVSEVKEEKEVSARHLLIGYKGAEGELSMYSKEEAKAKIDGLKKIATTANFSKLVAENSQEPGAVESKGDLGWFGKGKMAKSFEDAAFFQRIGTVSQVVESPFGFHLIWKVAERSVKNPHVLVAQTDRVLPEDLIVAEKWKATKLTGKQLKSARVDFDQNTGQIEVALQFDDEGTKLFGEITKKNVGKQVAIFLDREIISAPRVQTEILGGQAVITGNFGLEEAKLLARRLQAGALPVPVALIAQQTVGPTLGADSLQKSLVAGLIGFALVAIFMIALYRVPGMVSIAALLLYAAIVAAIFKLIPVTLSLSGIAGFILSLGIALDANVLVYERLKEELRSGKDLTRAMEEAFRRAWPSIRDGHMTVLISSVVLYWFSSSVIRGFAVTLAIGTIMSLFTAIVSTRTVLRLLVATRISRFGWLFLRKNA